VASAAGGANYHSWRPSGYNSLRESDRYSRRLRNVLTLPLLYLYFSIVLLILNHSLSSSFNHMLLTAAFTSADLTESPYVKVRN